MGRTTVFSALHTKIRTTTATLGIVGIGYVGTAVGKGAAQKGYPVLGFDVSDAAILRLNRQKVKKFTGTKNASLVFSSDVICICVPTPITEKKTPDLRPLIKALRMVGQYLRSGQLVIIESTVAPGTTRNLARPLLEEISELRSEKDFFLAFSPERIDPGNTQYTLETIPKVVGGIGKRSLALATTFYKKLITDVFPVTSTEVAEMSKMFENTFRMVNISLVNEVSQYTRHLGIDIVEVLQAASTKPYGFLPHYPGPGIGGHCIPVDPYYLLHDAKQRGSDLRIIEDALQVNNAQPSRVVDVACSIIEKTNGVKKRHRVLLLGVTYKPNISDTRESPALEIWEHLEKRGIEVLFHDPYIESIRGIQSMPITEKVLSDVDLSILITPHKQIKIDVLLASKTPILDTTSRLRKRKHSHIYHLFFDKKHEPKEVGDLQSMFDRISL